MKHPVKSTLILALLATSIACTSQNNETTGTTSAALTTATTATVSLKDEAQNTIFNQYLALKDALVLSDPAKAQQAATQLLKTLQANPDYKQQAGTTDSIANTSDLAKQRHSFTNLSNQLITVFRKAVLAKGAFYVQFCPMANEGDGGYWLAQEEDVRNPYYGDEMLNCGEVKETIK